jgi:DNA-binding transcriptional LysR family regulator
LTEAKHTLTQADRAVDAARRARTPHAGRLVIGAQATAEVSVLPRLLPRFLRRYPHVDVMLQTPLTPQEQVAMLKQHQIDVGFLRLPVRDSALRALPLLHEPLLAVLPRRHPLARRRSVSLQELAASTFLMFRRSNAPGLHDVIMGVWKTVGVTPKVLKEAMRMPTILSLVAAERGVSLVPRGATGLGRKGIVFRPVRPPLPMVEMGVAYRRGEHSLTVRAFLDMTGVVFHTSLPRP